MNIPFCYYLPVLAGIVAGLIGGRIYKNNQRKKKGH